MCKNNCVWCDSPHWVWCPSNTPGHNCPYLRWFSALLAQCVFTLPQRKPSNGLAFGCAINAGCIWLSSTHTHMLITRHPFYCANPFRALTCSANIHQTYTTYSNLKRYVDDDGDAHLQNIHTKTIAEIIQYVLRQCERCVGANTNVCDESVGRLSIDKLMHNFTTIISCHKNGQAAHQQWDQRQMNWDFTTFAMDQSIETLLAWGINK